MAIIQPVVRPNIANLLLQGLQAGTTFQARQQQLGRQRRIGELAETAGTDPQALSQLTALDPPAGRAVQQQQEFIARRFSKERAETAGLIEGQSPSDQIRILDQQIARVEARGEDAFRTRGLRDLITSGPEEFDRAQQIITTARIQGEREGFLKPIKPERPVKITALRENIKAAGFIEGTPEFSDIMVEALLRPTTQVSIGDKAQSAEDVELAKIRARRFIEIEKEAGLARDTSDSLEILRNIDLTTGKLEPLKQAIAAWGQAFGVDTSNLANVPAGQAFTAEAGKLLLQGMLRQKGRQTDRDANIIRNTLVALGNDPKANQFINDAAAAFTNRKEEEAEFWEDFRVEKTTFEGIEKAWGQHIRKIPLISRNRKENGLPIFFHIWEKASIAETQRVKGTTPTKKDLLQAWKEWDIKSPGVR